MCLFVFEERPRAVGLLQSRSNTNLSIALRNLAMKQLKDQLMDQLKSGRDYYRVYLIIVVRIKRKVVKVVRFKNVHNIY